MTVAIGVTVAPVDDDANIAPANRGLAHRLRPPLRPPRGGAGRLARILGAVGPVTASREPDQNDQPDNKLCASRLALYDGRSRERPSKGWRGFLIRSGSFVHRGSIRHVSHGCEPAAANGTSLMIEPAGRFAKISRAADNYSKINELANRTGPVAPEPFGGSCGNGEMSFSSSRRVRNRSQPPPTARAASLEKT